MTDVDRIRALTFDTGGTILDWHSGFVRALSAAGHKHGEQRDWPAIANELRRRSLKAMLGIGNEAPPTHNFDDAHRDVVEALIEEERLASFTDDDVRSIAFDAPHSFECWPDFPPILRQLRTKFMVASFTVLSYRIVIDTARKNGLSWDAVFSCEGIGKYKPLPESYRQVAAWLQLDPSECCMVACHPFDLDAAQAVGFRTALVRRPREWGPEPPPEPTSDGPHDIVVDDFPSLARALGMER